MTRPSQRYLQEVVRLLGEVETRQLHAITAAAELVARSVESGGLVHVFGTGHSHLLAQELCARAGGLAPINPILLDEPMLHAGAPHSPRLEQLADLAGTLLDEEPVQSRDVLVVVSHSGGNAACIEMAREARRRGVPTIAVESLRHATASDSSQRVRPFLHEVVDVVLDNCGRPGDACLSIPGLDQPIGATSTVLGAALLHAVLAEAVAMLVARGHTPDLFASNSTAAGASINAHLVDRYCDRVQAL